MIVRMGENKRLADVLFCDLHTGISRARVSVRRRSLGDFLGRGVMGGDPTDCRCCFLVKSTLESVAIGMS